MTTKILRQRIAKEELSRLPVDAFRGRILTILTEEEADKAIRFLLTQPIVGVDTETRPSFTSHRHNKVALLQLSTEEVCFLFRLNRIGFPAAVQQFFESEAVLKVGLSLRDDFNALNQRAKFEPRNVVDIQNIAPKFGIQDLSLQKIYANLFGCNISKSQRLTNWEADTLTDRQKVYAATDAWVCVRMYNYFNELQTTGNYQLAPLPTPETDDNETT